MFLTPEGAKGLNPQTLLSQYAGSLPLGMVDLPHL